MNELEQLEKDYALVRERGGRMELLHKLEAQIKRLKDHDIKGTTETTTGLKQQFDKLFRSADDEIRSQYVVGTAEYIHTHHPDLEQQISQATDKMQKLWKEGRKGEARINEFVAVLEQWKSFHLEAIKIFKEERK